MYSWAPVFLFLAFFFAENTYLQKSHLPSQKQDTVQKWSAYIFINYSHTPKSKFSQHKFNKTLQTFYPFPLLSNIYIYICMTHYWKENSTTWSSSKGIKLFFWLVLRDTGTFNALHCQRTNRVKIFHNGY